jgi:hypothetical protein
MSLQTVLLPGIERVKANRGWFMLLGILLVVVGSAAIGEALAENVES